MQDNFNSNKVSIIILNWNGWKDTIECLESLYQINYPNYEVIIVDNHSEDNSIEKIKNYCDGKLKVESEFFEYNIKNKPIKIFEHYKDEAKDLAWFVEFKNLSSDKKVMILKNDKNYGFAEGNNIGIRFALKNLDPEYILLLNNDTVVERDFLGELVNVSIKNPKIGVAGPKTYYYDHNGKRDVISFEGGKINFFKGEAYHISNKNNSILNDNTYLKCDYVEGSCFLVKTDVIRSIGLLDNDYFLYWEETDWCTRIKKEGYLLAQIQSAKIWHKVTNELNYISLYYISRNRFLFMRKNSNSLQMSSFLIYHFLFKFWIRLFIYLFYYKKPRICYYLIKGTLVGCLNKKGK